MKKSLVLITVLVALVAFAGAPVACGPRSDDPGARPRVRQAGGKSTSRPRVRQRPTPPPNDAPGVMTEPAVPPPSM